MTILLQCLSTIVLAPLVLGEGRILILHTLFGGSHVSILRDIGVVLRTQGFNVTHVTFTTDDHLHIYDKDHGHSGPSGEEIVMNFNNSVTCTKHVNDGVLNIDRSLFWNFRRRYWNYQTDSVQVVDVYCRTLLGDQNLLAQLRYANFTMALVDLAINECGLALAHHLNLPVVGFWGFGPFGGEMNIMRGFLSPAVAPDLMSEVSDLTVFSQRLWNFLTYLMDYCLVNFLMWSTDMVIREYLPDIPPSGELLMNVNVVLVNSHPILEYPTFLAPHQSFIGCISCAPPRSLSETLKSWIKPGAVLFSSGITGFRADAVPQEFIRKILYAFSLLPYRVVMRFDPRLVENVPSNVNVMEYIPQNDLLGSGSVVAFVTHCGIKSVMEAVYHKVPMVGVPVFGDQGDNAMRMVERGIAKFIDKDNFLPEDLAKAVVEVVTDSSYKSSIERLSSIMRMDREKPMDRVTHWVNMVDRYGSLDHLKANTRTLSILQHLMLDILVFLLGSSVFITFLLHRAVIFISRILEQKARKTKNLYHHVLYKGKAEVIHEKKE